MMFTNPANAAFAASVKTELVFGQVHIRRVESGFELGHVKDGKDAIDKEDLRALAQFTEQGRFRPLKSAPNLKPGWRIIVNNEEELGAALSEIYPGAVADWFATQKNLPPVTNYREFTNRQTGMYRITTMLDDATAGAVIRACCHKEFCLKCRHWSVEGLAPDNASSKSIIPCLEPCAILLEFARKIARLEKDGQLPLTTVLADPSVAESDFDSPANPRRVRFLLEKAGTTSTLSQD